MTDRGRRGRIPRPGNDPGFDHGGRSGVLIRPNNTMPQGNVWADARACADPAMPAAQAHLAVDRIRGFYGTGVSKNGTTLRPEGLGGSAG